MSADFSRWADVLPEPMLLVEVPSERLLGLNRAAASALQRPREELLGALMTEVFATPPEALRAYLRRAARGRELLPGALHLGGGADARTLRCHGARAPDGAVLLRLELDDAPASGFLVLTRKVEELARENTRRRRAEEALRASERRLQSIIDNSPQAIFLKDQRGEYLLMNQQFERFCGQPSEQVRGVTDEALFPPELARRFAELDRAALNSAAPVATELTVSAGGGEQTWLNTRFCIHDPNLDEVLLCGILQDLTERKRLEAEYQAIERAILEAQRLESLGVLAGGIAHDFNNLLTGILTNASLARESLEASSLARECVEDVLLAGERASELCAQLLAYAGRGELSTSAVDLAQLTQEMAHLLDISISKKATLRMDFAPELPPVEVDPGQLRQVIMNLIINASQALPGGEGTITLRGRPDGAAILLEVSDDGCGMDEEHLSRIFEPLFTTREGGHGLGLSAVQGIVRRHGGTIDIESAPGEGTTFTIRLPVGDSLKRPELHGPPTAPAASGATVLLIDDEALILNACKKILELAGYHVVTAADGRDALAHFSRFSGTIDALVMDIQMPRMSGLEALELIRSERPELPVLLMSGYVDEEDALAAWMSEGRTDFIPKPFSPGDFLDRVGRLLEADPSQRVSAV